jgi:hypothetical protein
MFFDPFDPFYSGGDFTEEESRIYWAGFTYNSYYRAGRVAECTCMNCKKDADEGRVEVNPSK